MKKTFLENLRTLGRTKLIVIGITCVVVCGAAITGIVVHNNSKSADEQEKPESVVTESTEMPETEETETELTPSTEEAPNVTEATEEVLEGTETEEELGYTYMELSKKMYVQAAVNIRKGPSTDFEKIGHLEVNEEVAVTGKCNETGWYRIEYASETGFISDKYLGESKVSDNNSVNNKVDSSKAETNTSGNNASTINSGTSTTLDTSTPSDTNTTPDTSTTPDTNTPSDTNNLPTVTFDELMSGNVGSGIYYLPETGEIVTVIDGGQDVESGTITIIP